MILDLEDSVLDEQVDLARNNVREAVKGHSLTDREILVRVNGINTAWCEADIRALADVELDGLVFPKVDSVRDVKNLEALMSDCGMDDALPVWLMIESPTALLDMRDILNSSKRVNCVLLGTADLGKALRMPETPGRLGLLSYLSYCVLVARDQGVDIIDGIFQNFKDVRGLEKACEQGRNLGFDGKSLIHPGQIETANRVFSPEPQAIEEAEQIVAAWQVGNKTGSGIVVYQGRMIEALHVESARNLLRRVQLIEASRHTET